MTAKLWGKEQNTETDAFVESFTVGQDRELDVLLARHDVEGTIAHITMLESVGLLETEELEQLKAELIRIRDEDIAEGSFVIEEGVEDVHSQIELMLTRKLGDAGKKIHAGRSRNDQVLVDIRLFLREQIREIKELTGGVFNALLKKADTHKDLLMPGYTHTQAAMPSSFGLWFGAYAESLVDDITLLNGALKVVNRNPLGSAAGYGSSFPLNRTLTTELLGFESMVYNSVYAQMGRGKTEQTVASAMAGMAATLNKMASDVCLYNSQNFQFLSLPDALTTGSSIMPHKKNPDVFELIRARTNRLMALPNELMMLTGNLTSGYHRDFQLLKEMLFPAIKSLKECLQILALSVPRIQPAAHILDDDKYRLIWSVEVVNRLVAGGTPFREAYREVARSIEEGSFEVPEKLSHTHEGSIGNLMLDEIRARMKSELEKGNGAIKN